ncbi:MAG: nucleotidyltransferase domain-containing protein [Thermoleophilia bacterium]
MGTVVQRSNNKIGRLSVGSPEWRLLILTAALQLDESKAATLRRLLAGGIDWDLLLYHASFHGTTGLIYRNLVKLDEEGLVQPEIWERLKSTYLMTAALSMQQMANFKSVAEELAASGIKIIALKGVVLAESVYGDLGLRPFADVDVLVQERDWPQIIKVLKKQQFQPGEEEYTELPPKLTRYDTLAHIQYASGRSCLEFQFDLFTLGIGMRDIDGVWERVQEARVAGASVCVLSLEDQLLHLAVHANRHGCMQLKWLVDIAETLRQSSGLDWGLVKSIACQENILTSVYSTLSHIERLFDCRLVEPAIMTQLTPRGYRRALWRVVWPQKQLDRFEGRNEDSICFYFYRPLSGWNLINFVVMGRIRDKLAYQGRWIMPSLAWMSQTYNEPRKLSLLKYYPLRFRYSRSRKWAARNSR